MYYIQHYLNSRACSISSKTSLSARTPFGFKSSSELAPCAFMGILNLSLLTSTLDSLDWVPGEVVKQV